jgi:hypothetical protein
MKKRLFFSIILTFGILSTFAQQQKLDFVQKKMANDGFTVYFQVENITDSEHAEKILNDLLSDANIIDGRYFKSGNEKDRYQLYINNIITANYVRDILLTNNVDYDYSTIIVNGVNPEHINAGTNSLGSSKSNVSALGFPSYENTGDKELDDSNYKKSKEEWIQENPEEYESMLKELENKNN